MSAKARQLVENLLKGSKLNESADFVVPDKPKLAPLASLQLERDGMHLVALTPGGEEIPLKSPLSPLDKYALKDIDGNTLHLDVKWLKSGPRVVEATSYAGADVEAMLDYLGAVDFDGYYN